MLKMEKCPDVLVLVPEENKAPKCFKPRPSFRKSPENCVQLTNSNCSKEPHSVEKERDEYKVAASKTIQLGEKLNLSKECIDVILVYLHKFHLRFSLKEYSIETVVTACFVLATKFGEYDDQRTLDFVLYAASECFRESTPSKSGKSQINIITMDKVIQYECDLLHALDFKVRVENPHYYVSKLCKLIQGLADILLEVPAEIGDENISVQNTIDDPIAEKVRSQKWRLIPLDLPPKLIAGHKAPNSVHSRKRPRIAV